MAVNLVSSFGRARARELLGVVLRPVPGRPVRRRAGPGRGPARAGGRAVRRGDALRPRRRRRVRAAAAADRRPGEGAVPRLAGQAAHGGGRRAGRAAPGRRHPGAVGTAAGAGRRPRPRASPTSPTRGRWCSPRTSGPAGWAPIDFPTPVTRAGPGAGAQELQPPQPARPPRPRLDAAQRPRRERPRRPAGQAPLGGRRRPGARTTCAGRCARHPVHALPDREERVRVAERWLRSVREADALQRKMAERTGSLTRQFDATCDVLEELGYLVPEVAPLVPADTEVDRRRGRRPGGHRRRTAAGPDLVGGRPAGRRVPAGRAPGGG